MSDLKELKYDGAYINGRYSGYIHRVVFAGNEASIASMLKAILTKATGGDEVETQPEMLVEKIYSISGERDTVDWAWLDLRTGNLRNRLFSGKADFRLAIEPQSKMYCLVIDSVGARKLDQAHKDCFVALKNAAGNCAVYCIETSTYDPYAATFTLDQTAYLLEENDMVVEKDLNNAIIELINYVLYIRLWCDFDTNDIPLRGRPYFTRLLYISWFDVTNGIKNMLTLALEKNELSVAQVAAAKYVAFDMDRGIENEMAILLELFSIPEYDTSLLTNPDFAAHLLEKTTSTKDKALIAAFCLGYDVKLSEEQRTDCISIVRRGKKKIFESILLKKQDAQLRGLIQNKVWTIQEVEKLIGTVGLFVPDVLRELIADFKD